MSEVIDNAAASRFELQVEGETAIADYVRKGDVLVFTHTLVPEHVQERGIGSRLAKGALDLVKAKGGLKVDPRCPFIAAFIRKHPEYQPLLATQNEEAADQV